MADRDIRLITKRTSVPGKMPTGTTGSELNLIKQGELASNLSDKKLYSYDGSNIFEFGSNSFLGLTGGTISGNIIVNSISANTYLGLPVDTFVTGFTYNNANTFTITNNTGGTLTAVINMMTGLTVNGSLSATTYTGNTILLNTSGSGTVGLLLNTVSTQDSKLHFSTNNSSSARARLYVEDATQTFNLYTLNSDTIFWNGNGLAQSKTLTLYTDTTAKFENKLTVGSLNIQNTLSGVSVYGLAVDSSGNVISAITNSIDVYVTGGTYSNGTAVFTNNTGGTFSVTGFSTGSTVTLQQAYNASTTPEITTNSTLGAFTIKDGVGSASTVFDVINSASTNIFSLRNDGVSNFSSSFDGVGAGNYNYSYSTDVGGLLIDYNSIAGTSLRFLESTLLKASLLSYGGYTNLSSKYRIALKSLDDNKNHLWMDASNGYIGVGDDYFVADASLHIKGVGDTSSGYSLKIDNSASTPSLYVRNDGVHSAYFHNTGKVYMGTSTIGKSSASNGVEISALGQASWVFGFNNGELRANGTFDGGKSMDILSNSTSNFQRLQVSSGALYWDNGIVANDYKIRGILNSESLTTDILTIIQSGTSAGNTGLGENTPTAKLHIRGSGITSSTYALKIDDLALAQLLHVRNDGIVSVGSNITIDGKDVTNYPITIRSSRNDLTRMQILNGGATQTDLQIATNNGANSIYYGVSSTNNAFIDNRTTGNLLFQNGGVSQMIFNTIGDFGIGENTPTSKLHIKGSGTTSSGYALKVDNNSSNPLLYVRNDGKVGIGNLATGSTFSVSSTNNNIFRTSAVGTYNTSTIESDNYSASLNINAATDGPVGGYNSGIYLNSNGVYRGSFNAESTTSVTTLESAGGYWLLLKNSTTESIGLGQGGNYIQFNTNGTSKMLIDGPTGNVAIGSPIFVPTAKLHVSGNTIITGGLTVETISSTVISGGTLYSGSTNLYSIFAQTGSTLVQKSGTVSGSTFAGDPKKATVTFATAFSSANYSITFTSDTNRTFTWESKLAGSFVINSNSNTAFSDGNVDWVAIEYGEK